MEQPTDQQHSQTAPATRPESSAGGADASRHHHHHHHRHHHRTPEERRRDEERERREERRKLLKRSLWAILPVTALLVIAVALLMPQYLMRFAGGSSAGSKAVPVVQDAYQQIKYDGMDVSYDQGVINWDRVVYDTCVRFVYIKATEGASHVDDNYVSNVEEARKAGVRIGSYHRLTSHSDVDDQYENFSKTVEFAKQDIVPMVMVEAEDVKEWTRQQVQDNLARLLQQIESRYGYEPVLRVRSGYYNENLAPRFDGYVLFLTDYDKHHPVTSGSARRQIWQEATQGVVDGVPTPVGLERLAPGLTLDQLVIRR